MMELIDTRYILNWSLSIAVIFVVLHICGGKKKKKKTSPAKKRSSSVSKSPVTKEEQSRTPEARTPETKTPEKEKEEVKKEEVKESKETELKPSDPPKYTEKEQAIANGALKKRTDYPTIDDVVSDWGEEEKKK